MKLLSLFIGVVIGFLLCFFLTNRFKSGSQIVNNSHSNLKTDSPVKWPWPDSLDAVKAAKENHKIVFENDQVRILEVTLNPYEFEKMHTHQFPSVMWGSDNDAPGYDIVYYRYKYDSANHVYYVKDSNQQHGGGQPNVGNGLGPEGPHRIRNLSNERIVAYRVEFKKSLR
jgi:hypothetical protein